jgi:hypothetical protein
LGTKVRYCADGIVIAHRSNVSPIVNKIIAENIQGIGVSGPFTGLKIINVEGTIRPRSKPRKILGIKNADAVF